MERRTYNFAVGIILLIVALAFFALPGLLDIDGFMPFMFALVSFMIAIYFFFMGQREGYL